MPTIREVKTELRHREWAEQIQECQSSGMTVTAWCKEKGISQHTYYSRLNVVRKELLKRAGLPLQQIVPLSVSQSVTCTTATMKSKKQPAVWIYADFPTMKIYSNVDNISMLQWHSFS